MMAGAMHPRGGAVIETPSASSDDGTLADAPLNGALPQHYNGVQPGKT